MKKTNCAAMAAVLALGVQVTAFCAALSIPQTSDITALTGLPINENGKRWPQPEIPLRPTRKFTI
jgi:hypothetical protein